MLLVTARIAFITIISVDASKILVILPTPSYSHGLFINTIYQELAERGHDITAVTTFKSKSNLTNLNEIELKYPYIPDMNNYKHLPGFAMNSIILSHFADACEFIYSNPDVQTLLKTSKFDLIITEWYPVPCFSILKKHFKAPLIGIRSLSLRLEAHDHIGNPTLPSYLPVAYNEYSEDFLGRLKELMVSLYWRINYHLLVVPKAQGIVRKYFPDIKDGVLEMEKSVDLILTNSNYILHGVRPIVPAMIDVGFLHIGRNVENLSKEIKLYLDNSKGGVIYFNLGSMLRMDAVIIDKILEAFKELPYHILWKHDSNKSNLPKNVKISKWLPQESILAHPNLKGFINHGGLLSVQEAIYYKIPVLAIPSVCDTPYIAHRIEKLGIGRKLQIFDINKNSFKEAVLDIARNTSYKENIKYINRLISDQLMKPMDKAMWWIEYTIRNKGAPLIQSRAVHMNWFTYLLLDVILFVLTTIVFMIKMIKFLIRIIRPRSKKVKNE